MPDSPFDDPRSPAATGTLVAAAEGRHASDGTERWREVDAALDSIRPAMEADGGGVAIERIEGDVVVVRLRGVCLACPSSALTLRRGIEPTLRRLVPWVARVERVA